MNRIQNVSSRFLVLFQFLIVCLPALAIFKWLCIKADFMKSMLIQNTLIEPYHGPEGVVSLTDVSWAPLTQCIALFSDMLALLPMIISLYALIHIFKHYKNAEIFNMSNARYYRLIGWMFILDGLITKALSGALMAIAVTLNNAPGHRYITLQFGSLNLEAIFCGAVLIVISWVMLEASKLHEDQQYTV